MEAAGTPRGALSEPAYSVILSTKEKQGKHHEEEGADKEPSLDVELLCAGLNGEDSCFAEYLLGATNMHKGHMEGHIHDYTAGRRQTRLGLVMW